MASCTAEATTPGGCEESRPSPRSRHEASSTPSSAADCSNSFRRTAPSSRRVAVDASRIWPASPCVSDTIAVTAPAPPQRAMVPPTQNTSSSGCANSPRTRGARPVGTAEPNTSARSSGCQDVRIVAPSCRFSTRSLRSCVQSHRWSLPDSAHGRLWTLLRATVPQCCRRGLSPSNRRPWSGGDRYAVSGGRDVADVGFVERRRPAGELEQRAVRVLEVERADEHVAVVGRRVVVRLVAARRASSSGW